jgi:hypothetical protein
MYNHIISLKMYIFYLVHNNKRIFIPSQLFDRIDKDETLKK